jgi:carbonic anhydrase
LLTAMKRQIKWVDKSGDVKRELRVTFLSGDQIKWQFKRADCASWDYDTPPSDEEWAELQQKVENRYQRGSAQVKDVELVKKLRRN